jgi:hypothetical protein
VPLDADADPPVLMSEDRKAMQGCQQVADERIFGCVCIARNNNGKPFPWARGGELNLSSFKLKLKPLLIGASYVIQS